MVLPVKELPHFEGKKREDVITFIWHVLRELGGHAAPFAGLGRGYKLGSPSTERWWSTTFKKPTAMDRLKLPVEGGKQTTYIL